MSALIHTDKSIEVAGQFNFPQARWREAILFFLFGIWSGDKRIIVRPQIKFGMLTLKLSDANGFRGYWARGKGIDMPNPYPNIEIWTNPPYPRYKVAGNTRMMILAGNGQDDVELGLVRFAKDRRVALLQILIDQQDGSRVILWKGEARGEYFISTDGPIPA